MENWGLVTYRTTAVLFEEGKSDSRYKNRVAYVVAHGKTYGHDCGDSLSNSFVQNLLTNGSAISSRWIGGTSSG